MEADGFWIFCTQGQDQRPSVWVKMPGNPKRDFPDAHTWFNMACEAQPGLRQALTQFLLRTRRGPYANGRDAAYGFDCGVTHSRYVRERWARPTGRKAVAPPPAQRSTLVRIA